MNPKTLKQAEALATSMLGRPFAKNVDMLAKALEAAKAPMADFIEEAANIQNAITAFGLDSKETRNEIAVSLQSSHKRGKAELAADLVLAKNMLDEVSNASYERGKSESADRIRQPEQINANLMGDDENLPRYTTKRFQFELEKALQAAELQRGPTPDMLPDAVAKDEKAMREHAQPTSVDPDRIEKRLSEYQPNGEGWFHVNSIDEMQAFYLSRLPAIRDAAKELGYAIGLHGSTRRDFDLMAMPWRDDAADKEMLAHAIAKSACGIGRAGEYNWTVKPAGRIATSIPICWDEVTPRVDGMGVLDLSVMPTPPAPQPREKLQDRVYPWLLECFGPEISADKLERTDRFIEEALELLQSGDYPKERVYSLIEYVYGREKGEPAQEVGGVMTTLAAYCLAHGLDMHEAGEKELARIWTKVDKIRAKQAAKPHGSALPIAIEIAPAPTAFSLKTKTDAQPNAELTAMLSQAAAFWSAMTKEEQYAMIAQQMKNIMAGGNSTDIQKNAPEEKR